MFHSVCYRLKYDPVPPPVRGKMEGGGKWLESKGTTRAVRTILLLGCDGPGLLCSETLKHQASLPQLVQNISPAGFLVLFFFFYSSRKKTVFHLAGDNLPLEGHSSSIP